MIRNYMFAGTFVAAGIGAWVIFSTPSAPPETENHEIGAALVKVTVPDALSPEAKMGQRAYETTCVNCHGKNGRGRNGMGPPLVHKIYEPSHHGDESFQRAVAAGVRAHHWGFGDMAPIDGFTRADVKTVIAFLRELQRANGIN